jgi:hypothetical protein
MFCIAKDARQAVNRCANGGNVSRSGGSRGNPQSAIRNPQSAIRNLPLADGRAPVPLVDFSSPSRFDSPRTSRLDG